jgi:hypothetical protein
MTDPLLCVVAGIALLLGLIGTYTGTYRAGVVALTHPLSARKSAHWPAIWPTGVP